MYTQCPECDVAFRVTADILKQAAGKVRCGGCGVAFNALAHLSEEMPVAATRDDSNPKTTEVETDQPGELEAGTPPKSISAEQSAALLKTLDQLAGEDIRIEDTGVEWRVLSPGHDADEFEDDPVPSAVHEEMRFDDDTPLPDDFDLDAPSAVPPEPGVEVADVKRPMEDSQVDLAFGEPDEWEDLLDDLEEVAASVVADEEIAEIDVPEVQAEPGDISEETSAAPDIEEIEAEAATDGPLDMDTQFAIQAEAMGIDLSGMHEKVEPGEDESDTSIEEDLMAAAFEVEEAAKTEVEAEFDLDDVAPEDLTRAGILDEDDYLEVPAEADPEQDDEPGEEAEPDEEAEPGAAESGVADPGEQESEEYLEACSGEELEAKEDIPVVPSEAEIEAELELALEDLQDEEDGADPVLSNFAEPKDIEVPELTEEELTVNLMIDQDLLAIAVEDDDGFTSTIVQKQLSSESDIPREKTADHTMASESAANQSGSIGPGIEEPVEPPKETAQADALMETIIMEGDVVHSERDLARLDAQKKAASESLEKSGFNRDTNRDRHREPPKYGKIAASVLLFILLLLQVAHHSREALATLPAFQKTVGSVYRMIGRPVTPAWDIRGWRFEATKGTADEDNKLLTIFSRVGNKSDQALPYPLVHVSLTDRFEEIIGSRVLEPGEYLVDNADPRRPVQPNDTFDAVIAIQSPSANATSFKLDVCYRLTGGRLRCAIEDFK